MNLLTPGSEITAPMTSTSSIEELAAKARKCREAMEAAKRQHAVGALTYDQLAEVAKAFCAAFYDYQVEKVGKSNARKPDYRKVIR